MRVRALCIPSLGILSLMKSTLWFWFASAIQSTQKQSPEMSKNVDVAKQAVPATFTADKPNHSLSPWTISYSRWPPNPFPPQLSTVPNRASSTPWLHYFLKFVGIWEIGSLPTTKIRQSTKRLAVFKSHGYSELSLLTKSFIIFFCCLLMDFIVK